MYDLGGAIRAIDAAATIDRVRPLWARLGITRLANITGLDRVGIPTWMAIRPQSRSLSTTQGKGLTHELAKASAVMEAVEQYHGGEIVPPGENLTIREARQSDRCAPINLLHRRERVALTDAAVTRWVVGREATTGCEKWVPHDLFNLDSSGDASRLFHTGSNGLAAGNTFDEAILHGLCEVIERDQTSFWQLASACWPDRPSTRVRLETIRHPSWPAILEQCHAAGLEVFVDYLTTNIGLPVFQCLVADVTRRSGQTQVAGGWGCHPKKGVALLRALTEALQSRLTLIASLRDDMYWSRYRNGVPADTPLIQQSVAEFRAIPEAVSFDDISDVPDQPSFAAYGEQIVAILATSGIPSPVVVDLTQPEIGIPVVYVWVPGSEYPIKHEDFSPGPRMIRFLQEEMA